MKKYFLGIFLSLSLLLVFTSNAFAQNNVYFDYSPDPWNSQRFVASTASSIEQAFQVGDEVELYGIDLWLDNTSSAGSISLSVSNSVGAVLASKTLTLEHLTAVAGGNKFHVDFGQAINLKPGVTYTFKVSSNLLGLGIYYTNSLASFLTHNEELVSEYLRGRARIDGLDQEFTFKYTLYANVLGEDSSVPDEEVEDPVVENGDIVIFGAKITNVNANSVSVSWSTNLAANSGITVRQQINPLYVIASSFDPLIELEHSISATGLKPGILYFVDVYSGVLDSEDPVKTYTIAFKTNNASAPDPVIPPDEGEDPVDEGEDPVDEGEDPVDEGEDPVDEGEEEVEVDEDGNISHDFDEGDEVDSNDEQVEIEDNGDGSFSLTWSGGSGGGGGSSGSGGSGDGIYRVDVFDENNNLIRQINVSGGLKSTLLSDFAGGAYRTVVYEKTEDFFDRIAVGNFHLQEKQNSSRFRGAYIVFSVSTLIGLFAFLLYRKRKKSEKTS